jgi:hypothetical protein
MMNPADRNNQPIRFSGRLDARTIPITAPTPMFTTAFRTFGKFQRYWETEAGTAAWRKPNMRTSAPIISAIEKLPTDHASLEAVLGLILAIDTAPHRMRMKGWQRDATIGAHPRRCRRGATQRERIRDVQPVAFDPRG